MTSPDGGSLASTYVSVGADAGDLISEIQDSADTAGQLLLDTLSQAGSDSGTAAGANFGDAVAAAPVDTSTIVDQLTSAGDTGGQGASSALVDQLASGTQASADALASSLTAAGEDGAAPLSDALAAAGASGADGAATSLTDQMQTATQAAAESLSSNLSEASSSVGDDLGNAIGDGGSTGADALSDAVSKAADKSSASLISGLAIGGEEGGEKAGESVVAKLREALSVGSEAILGTAVALSIAEAFKTGIEAEEQYQVVTAQTEAVIKSTGGTAGVTSEQVRKLAENIAGYSGDNTEAVQSSENLLLRFQNVHDELGKGNDVFTQATKSAADLSAAYGKGLTASAQTLGRALNDPINGLTALRKLGITFTDSQKATIKSLVDEGNTLGAQKIILDQVNTAVGGAAKAYGDTLPGELGKTKGAFEDVARTLTEVLLPIIDPVVGGLATGLEDLVKPAEDLETHAVPAITSFEHTIVSAADKIISDVGPVGPAITSIADDLGHLASEAEPAARIVAGLTFETIDKTATIAGGGIRLLATGVHDLTGFIDSAKPELGGLGAALLAIKLAPSVALIPSVLRGITVAAADAGVALEGKLAAGLGAVITPAGAAAVGVGLLAAAWLYSKQQADDASTAAKNWVSSLAPDIVNQNYRSVAQLSAAYSANSETLQDNQVLLQGQNKHYQDSIAISPKVRDQLKDLTKAQQENATELQTYLTNLGAVGKALGLTADQTQALAHASGVDLSGSVQAGVAALQAAAKAHGTTAKSAGELAAQEQSVSDAETTASDAANTLSTALQLLNGDQVDAAEAQNKLVISIGNIKDSLDKSSRSLDVNTTAGATNADTLLDLLKSAEDVAVAQVKSGTAAGTAAAQYGTNAAAIETAGVKAGISAGAMAALIKQENLTPDQVETTIVLNTADAQAALTTIQNQYTALEQPIITKIYTQYVASGESSAQALDDAARLHDLYPNGHATGGLITGSGSGTSDSIATRLSNGEFVENAKATKANLALLEAINNGMSGADASSVAGAISGTSGGASGSFGSNADSARTNELLAQQNELLHQQNALLAKAPAATGQSVGDHLNTAGGASILRTRGLPAGARP
jgi:hypothetical protein